MEEKHMAVAFTGHRPETIPYIDKFESEQYFALQKLIWQEALRYIKAGYNTFYCGTARGADMLCGEIILAEKETDHPELKLICAIPFKEQAKGWGITEKMQYRELLMRSDRVVQVLCIDIPLLYDALKMQTLPRCHQGSHCLCQLPYPKGQRPDGGNNPHCLAGVHERSTG